MKTPIQNNALYALLLCTGIVCFGLLFGILFGLGWMFLTIVRDSFSWKGFPVWVSRHVTTLFCLGYLPFLAFWGNFTQFTGLPRLEPPDAFWLLNSYTFLLELFLLFSHKNDSNRVFLFLIAMEQFVSGTIFYPQVSSLLMFAPTLWFAFVFLNLQAQLMQAKSAFRFETTSLCEFLVARFSSENRPAASKGRRTALMLGKADEEEIRFRLKPYPVEILRQNQTLQFRTYPDSMNSVPFLFEASPAASHSRVGRSSVRWTFSFLIFGIIFFIFSYRPTHFQGGNFGWNVPASIGYSETSRLGEIGPQLGNPAPFFWLRLYEDDGSKTWKVPLKPDSGKTAFREPMYLRGAVFDQYTDAEWKPSSTMRGVNPTNTKRRKNFAHENMYLVPEIFARPGLIRMEETFEPTTEETFFACWPCFVPPIEFDFPSKFVSKKEKISFGESEPTPGVPYSLLTSGFRIQQETGAFFESEWTPCMAPILNPELLKKPNPEEFPFLEATAQEWVNSCWNDAFENGTPPTMRELALTMSRKLAESPQFHYSTSAVKRERGLDPVEDFMKNNPQGHCEFFASALVLMLRSQGVPARYVVGFAPQEYSPLANAWVVRHQDAHAWVEAWIPPREIPAEVISSSSVPPSFWQNGAWLRLDPTSGNLLAERDATRGLFFTPRDVFRTILNNYILNLNFQTQQKWIYEPIQKFFVALNKAKNMRQFLLCAVLLSFCVFFLFYTKQKMRPNAKTEKRSKNIRYGKTSIQNAPSSEDSESAPSAASALRRSHAVAFYHELEDILKSNGFVRKTGETSLEFVHKVETETGREDLVPLTWKYYAMRFRVCKNGNERLDIF